MRVAFWSEVAQALLPVHNAWDASGFGTGTPACAQCMGCIRLRHRQECLCHQPCKGIANIPRS